MLGRAALIFISLVACLMIAGVVMTPRTVQAQDCPDWLCGATDENLPSNDNPDSPSNIDTTQPQGGGFCDGWGGFLCQGICSVAGQMCENGEPITGTQPNQDGVLICSVGGQAKSCSDDAVQQYFQTFDAGCKAGSEASCALRDAFCLQNPGACGQNSSAQPIKTGGAVFWGVDCDGSANNLSACADLAKNLKTSCLRDKDGCDQYDEVCSGSAVNFCNEVTKDLPAYNTGIKLGSNDNCSKTQPGCPGYVPPPSELARLTDEYKKAVSEREILANEYNKLNTDPEFRVLADQYNSKKLEIIRIDDYLATNPNDPDPILIERLGQLQFEINEMEKNNPGIATRLIDLKNKYEAANNKVKDLAQKIANNVESEQGGLTDDPVVQEAIAEAYL